MFTRIFLCLLFLSVLLDLPASISAQKPCPRTCRRSRKAAKKDCIRKKSFRKNCKLSPCRRSSTSSGWSCVRRDSASRPTPTAAPSREPIEIIHGCRDRCYLARSRAFRDCRYRKRPVRGCAIVPCAVVKTGKQGWKCGPSAAAGKDVNGDGKVDVDDLVSLLRRIADPLGKVKPGDLTGDLNMDGKVDFADAQEELDFLLDRDGPDSLLPLTASYDTDHDFNWDQESLSALNAARFGQSQRILPPSLSFLDRQAMKTCGQPSAGSYKKGNGPRPTINWDDGFPFNPSVKAEASDYWNWARYTAMVNGAELLGKLKDGTKAYRRYRDASGAELTVDYEKGIQEDSAIQKGFNDEMKAVENAVKEMHNGKEASFEFHSTDSRLVDTVTENWDKAVGGHRIWSTGTVAYDAGSCQLTADITVMVEDFYNFNKGQVDKVTGLPDNDNGRFEVLGWAKSFFSRAEVKRTVTIPLQCCQDSDCGNETEFDCTCNKCVTQCPTQQRSGGQGTTSFTVDLFKTQGIFTVAYNMFVVPDELTITYEGAQVFGTGGLVSGTRAVQVSYGSATSTSTVVTVTLNAPNSGTRWTVSVACPP